MNKERENILKENHIRAFEDGKYKDLLKQENANYKQALNEIKEYINNHKRNLIHPITQEEYEELDDENINKILQIIDKVLGDEK